MTKSNDLTDKEILAMAKKTPKKVKRVLFKDYCGTYINLGLEHKDAHTIKQELPAVAKRGVELIVKDILRKTQMPTKWVEGQKPFITVIIYPGIVDSRDGEDEFFYPSVTQDYRIEEV